MNNISENIMAASAYRKIINGNQAKVWRIENRDDMGDGRLVARARA